MGRGETRDKVDGKVKFGVVRQGHFGRVIKNSREVFKYMARNLGGRRRGIIFNKGVDLSG